MRNKPNTKAGDAPKPGAVGAAIKRSRTKYGLRTEWGKFEYAQEAITLLYPARIIPKHLNHLRLTDAVNELIKEKHPDFGATHGKINRLTVRRALAALREILTPPR
jgi:hypothetical protein